jgi:hypothetical protein
MAALRTRKLTPVRLGTRKGRLKRTAVRVGVGLFWQPGSSLGRNGRLADTKTYPGAFLRAV